MARSGHTEGGGEPGQALSGPPSEAGVKSRPQKRSMIPIREIERARGPACAPAHAPYRRCPGAWRCRCATPAAVSSAHPAGTQTSQSARLQENHTDDIETIIHSRYCRVSARPEGPVRAWWRTRPSQHQAPAPLRIEAHAMSGMCTPATAPDTALITSASSKKRCIWFRKLQRHDEDRETGRQTCRVQRFHPATYRSHSGTNSSCTMKAISKPLQPGYADVP